MTFKNMLEYLSSDNVCFLKLTVRFSEKISSTDKCSSVVSHEKGANCLIDQLLSFTARLTGVGFLCTS